MTTIAQWQANDLQTVLYRLLVKGTIPQEPVTDHSEGKGLFETAAGVDPFGSVFRMMTGKEDQETVTEKIKPVNNGDKRWKNGSICQDPPPVAELAAKERGKAGAGVADPFS